MYKRQDVYNAELDAVEEPVAVNKGDGAIVVYSHLNVNPDALLTAAMSISNFTVPPAEHSIDGEAFIAPTVGVPVQGGNWIKPMSSITTPGSVSYTHLDVYKRQD